MEVGAKNGRHRLCIRHHQRIQTYTLTLASESEFYPFLLKMKYVDHLEKFCYGCGIFYAYKHLKGRLELSSSLAPLKSEFSVKEAAAEGSPDLLRAKCTRIQEQKVVKKMLNLFVQ